MHGARSLFLCGVLLFITAPCHSALIADLAADYRAATTLGHTSDDVGISGTLGGSWHYYQDSDNTPSGGNTGLLRWTTDSDYENSETGYAGTNVVNGFPVPVLSSDRLFDGPTPAPPAGSLMGHPANTQGVAIEYRAHPTGQVDNLSVDYRFEKPNLTGGVTIHIIETPNNSVHFTKLNLGSDAANQTVSGTISIGSIGTLSPGESLWLMLLHDGNNVGDQTWLQMTLNGNPVGIPEPSGLTLVAMTLAYLAWLGRRQQAGFNPMRQGRAVKGASS